MNTNSMLAILIGFTLIVSCKSDPKTENKSASTTTNGNYELWAEQIECDIKATKPEEWAQTDWDKAVINFDKKKMFDAILSAVKSGKQKGYDFFSNKELSAAEVGTIISHTDTVFSEDPKTGALDKKIESYSVSANDIALIKVREKWLFDSTTFTLKTQPTMLLLCVNKLSETGEVMGQAPLFYVKLNN